MFTQLGIKIIPWMAVASMFFVHSCASITELSLPPESPQIVINGLFTPDSTWKINVSPSHDVLYYNPKRDFLEDATVMLWEEDSLMGTLSYAGQGNYRLNAYPKAGVTYRVRVEADGFEPVEAEDQIPLNTPEIRDPFWDFGREVVAIDYLGVAFTATPLTFQLLTSSPAPKFCMIQLAVADSCDCMNGQEPIVYGPNRFGPGNYLSFSLDNRFPLNEPIANRSSFLMFSTETIGEGMVDIEVFMPDTTFLLYNHFFQVRDSLYFNQGSGSRQYFPPLQKTYVRMYLEVWNMSEALYRYRLSYLTQGYNTADPFATHINVFSNTTNRRGIFAGYQISRLLIYQFG